jgi:hypothetical protein
MNKIPRSEFIAQALAYVYTDFDQYVKDQAKEHTIANLGQSLSDYGCYGKPEHLVASAFSQLRENYGMELGDDAAGVDEEYRDWLKEAKKNCEKVRKAGLPWTLSNSRDAFEQRGAFAKVKK